MKVQVQIMNGRRFHLVLDLNDTIDDVKAKITNKEGIHDDQQQLLLNGIRLREGTVEDLYIGDGALLFLVLRLRGG